MHHHHGKQDITRARALREHMTDVERQLWYKLREFKQLGYHFRRQSPFRAYVLDFVEHHAKLVVELDGSQHGLPEQARHDEKRDALLQAEGYLVLRFWNSEIGENLESVADTILRQLQRRDPHPTIAAGDCRPPHKGEVKKGARPLPRKGVRRLA
jgi:very-short-patch-repair endonuclease